VASHTISNQPWPSGTVVSVYSANALPVSGDGTPVGVAITSATVSGSSVTFSGLSENVRYLAYAAGVGKRFLIPQQDPMDARSLRARVDELEGDTLPAVEVSVDEQTLSAMRILSTDDTAGMQARLNAAGGELVEFRDNTYTLTAPLLVNHRQRITGNGYQTVIIPPAGQPAIDCRGQGIEIGRLRIKGQSASSRPAAASHGILIDASNNVASGFYEHYNVHDIDFEYLKGYALKGLHGFRQSRIRRINAKACGDTGVATLHFESFTGDADQINYLKFRDIEILSMHGIAWLFQSNQGSASRVGCYGNSIKDSVIHGGDEGDANFMPIVNAHGLVLNGASHNVIDDLHVTNIEKTSYGVWETAPSASFPSLLNRFRLLTLGGVHGLAAAFDPTQTGGIGAFIDEVDSPSYEIAAVGLSTDYAITANANRVQMRELTKVGADTTTGTDASTTTLAGAIARANLAMGGKRITTIGTAGTSPALQLGILGSSNQPGIYFSDPTPEGAVTAPPGSVYFRRTGGGVTTLYVKETGTGNTGWIAK
jgi:hypothetical protein